MGCNARPLPRSAARRLLFSFRAQCSFRALICRRDRGNPLPQLDKQSTIPTETLLVLTTRPRRSVASVSRRFLSPNRNLLAPDVQFRRVPRALGGSVGLCVSAVPFPQPQSACPGRSTQARSSRARWLRGLCDSAVPFPQPQSARPGRSTRARSSRARWLRGLCDSAVPFPQPQSARPGRSAQPVLVTGGAGAAAATNWA
jgi:hypothetical protein